MAPPMVTYRRVPGDLEEATLIATLMQADLDSKFDALKKDIPLLTKRLNMVAKWNAIASDLATPFTVDDDPAPNPAAVVHDTMVKTLTAEPEGGDAKGNRPEPKKTK
jgi:hypothetical protein